MKLAWALLLSIIVTSPALAQTTLISTGAVWKYLIGAPDPGMAWRSNSFDDSSWPSGPAQLGWGDGDERSLIFSDPDTSEAPVVVYFREKFQSTNFVYTLTLRLLRDDGAVVYINGQEVWRDNMPGGAVDFQTFALTDVQTNESRYLQHGVFSDVLVRGENIVAVEVHQSQTGRGDCSFDFELIGDITREPPRITITSPTNGETFASGLVSLTVDATDADGHVTQVDYFIDGAFRESVTEPPFRSEASVGNGRHAVRALAYDNYGYSAWSAGSSFQVGGEWPVNILRGPYLQSVTATSAVVRWRTDWPTNGIVRFGTGFPPAASCVSNNVRISEHEVFIGGLAPDTSYFYSVGSDAQTFASGTDFVFRTAPTNTRPVTVWVIGDSGKADASAEAVRDGYLGFLGPENTDLWLMLGDNAYEEGTDDQYQLAVFDMYPDILRRVPLWPTLGNHDAASRGSPGEFPYFDIFTLPVNGEAGGVPSGTEKYYSFNYANIHLICLDSQSSSRAMNGPMVNWLREDLAATDQDWIVAFWHHPPYTKGTHNSDNEIELVEMRERVLPVLEDYGADLVLCGHSHVYERSYLLDGHYGNTNSFQPSMMLDATLGGTEAQPYRKPAGGLGAHRGTVYTVCGCSGEGGPSSFFYGRHPAMAQSLDRFGSVILRFDGLRVEAQFLRPEGSIDDRYFIDKSQPATTRPPLQLARTVNGGELFWPTSIPAYSLQTAFLAASNASWQPATNISRRAGRRNVANVGWDHTNQFFRLRAQP